jgi:outer membrane usher protein FimD/PapC
MAKIQKKSPRLPMLSGPLVLLGLGILLITSSFFPIGNLAAKSQWSKADSATYDKVTQEYKRSNYQSAARSGLSKEEKISQSERMKKQIDAMNVRLEHARNQPKYWSQSMLWAGAVLVAAGAMWHQLKSP